jgi:mRNA-degrading endonuclease RelE of RelBE toxin-antitoxin system
MPKYNIVLSKKAEKQLDKLSYNIVSPIFKAIGNLAIWQLIPDHKGIKN